MSGYGQAITGAKQARTQTLGSNRVRKARKVKKTFKQKLRNWLLDEDQMKDEMVGSLAISEDRLQSEGIRLQVYKASGGFVVETRGYDRKTDRQHNTMHIVTEEDDLGDRLGKIVMMEAMR